MQYMTVHDVSVLPQLKLFSLYNTTRPVLFCIIFGRVY